MTRGNAAAAGFYGAGNAVTKMEPDPTEQTFRYGAGTLPTDQTKPESSRAVAATGCR